MPSVPLNKKTDKVAGFEPKIFQLCVRLNQLFYNIQKYNTTF